MKDLMDRALDLATMQRAQYADIRVVNNRTETMAVKDGVVEALNFADTIGFGMRLLVNGAWGFASSCELSTAEIDRVTVKISRFNFTGSTV